ncbi:MAG: hypothetical protein GF375_06955 [Candidatus Omnitrophica bacterium]|nr:hypothetical protein [Candidatus Omnitrophota bacterium]MBD3269715.1 hypothetical protein [Candidatus Omnitrophota bacterium]
MKIAAGILILIFFFIPGAYPASCYGNRMPQQGKFFAGGQTYIIFERELEGNYGSLKSRQHFSIIIRPV